MAQIKDFELRKYVITRHNALKSDYSSNWQQHHLDIALYLMPRRYRIDVNQANLGTKYNQKIINNTGTQAAESLASGLFAGGSSSSRPWFRITIEPEGLMQSHKVRVWLKHVEDAIYSHLAKSNIYNCYRTAYLDMACFGTSALCIEEDDQDIIRGYNYVLGTYFISSNAEGRIDTISRERMMTVEQLVTRFGIDAVTENTRNLYKLREFNKSMKVIHCIQPNRDRDRSRLDAKGMPWNSIWLEDAAGEGEILAVKGFKEFPVMVSRWDVTGEDDYGKCPGMDALGDVKGLQFLEKELALMTEKHTEPPMSAPPGARSELKSTRPRSVTYVDDPTGKMWRPSIEVQPGEKSLEERIARHEARINHTFYASVIAMLLRTGGPQKTAREIQELHEEKIHLFSPVLERVHGELLRKSIDRIFYILQRNGRIMPAPEEIQGLDFKVEFISIMAQAQKQLGTVGVERLAGFVQALGETHPEAYDTIDPDDTVDAMARMIGTPPEMVTSRDERLKIRQLRADAERAAEERERAAAMREGAQAAKALSETDVNKQSALTYALGR